MRQVAAELASVNGRAWYTILALVALAAALAVAGCGIGARDVDYTPQRGYSADISASLNHGPTSSNPGMMGTEEPSGALPWDLNESGE